MPEMVALDQLRLISALRPLQKMLKDKELPSGRGWDEIRENLKGRYVEAEPDLESLYRELRIYGRKHIYLFKESAEVHQKLLDCEPDASKSVFGAVFPYTTPGLDTIAVPSLTKVLKNSTHRLFVFNSHRISNATETLDPRFLSDEAPEDVRKASSIKVIKQTIHQAYDVVAVPFNKRLPIEVRIDSFSQATSPAYDHVFMLVGKAIRKAAQITDPSVLYLNALNLFPAIQRIYDDGNEGRITDLEFMCPSSTKRRETFTAKRHSEGDLRTEDWHRAGKSVVPSIDIFHLAVTWSKNGDDHDLQDATLVLPGSIKDIRAKTLYEARVPSLCGRNEYRWMISRLVANLTLSSRGHVAAAAND